jgi:hypothetical protein
MASKLAKLFGAATILVIGANIPSIVHDWRKIKDKEDLYKKEGTPVTKIDTVGYVYKGDTLKVK